MKNFIIYQQFIQSIKDGKKHLIFGHDYVVLSRKMYDELVNNHTNEEFKSVCYDELNASGWIKNRFTKS